MRPHSLFLSDPNFLGLPPNLPSPVGNRRFAAQSAATVCAASKRNRQGIAKSGKLMLESAFIVASHLRILPEPVELLLREFGAGSGGRNGFRGGFGRGGSDGGRGRRRGMTRLGLAGILVITGAVGLWWIVGKEMALDSEALLGGLGAVLLGLSVEGWRRGVREWILGFCCCAVLVCLVSSKPDFGESLRVLGSMKKGSNLRRRSKGRRSFWACFSFGFF